MIRREEKKRRADNNTPQKASPFYNPQHKQDMAKLAITKDVLDTEEYMDELDLPYQKPEVDNSTNSPNSPSVTKKDETPKLSENGRPPLSKDSVPRKQKRVLPRSGEATVQDYKGQSTSYTVWGINAQDAISKVMTPAICDHFNKKNARALSKSEVDHLEYLKLCIFTGMKPLIPIDEKTILDVLNANTKPSQDFLSLSKEKTVNLENDYNRKLTSAEMKHVYADTFTDLFMGVVSISE